MRPALILSILENEYLGTRAGHHTPAMLWGPPGVGKSQMVSQVAAHHGIPMIDIRLSQLEPTDLRGIPFRVKDLVEWAIPAMLPDMRAEGDFWVQGSGFAEVFSADLLGFLVPTMRHPLFGDLVTRTG